MTDLEKALAEFRAAIWRERWTFVALYVAAMLTILIIATRAALGDPQAVWLWQLLWEMGR